MSNVQENIARVMRNSYGKDIYTFEESFLRKTLVKRLSLASMNSYTTYSELLSENSTKSEALFRSLTISFSEFFRNSLTFASIEQLIIPVLVDEKVKSGRQ